MIYLSTAEEMDTAPLALRCWQAGKTVLAPKVSWDQKRMMAIEISSLQTGMTRTGPGISEPISGKPVPVDMIDLVIVPGMGFSPAGIASAGVLVFTIDFSPATNSSDVHAGSHSKRR